MEVLIDLKQDFFAFIPTVIMIDILSRLPIPTIIRCKCVCKSWLNLVLSLDFAKSHFSRSLSECLPLTLALSRRKNSSNTYEILESLDTQNSGFHWKVVFKFNFPYPELHINIHSSANGLLLLLDKSEKARNRFICNPITHEYIKLNPSPRPSSIHQESAFGFGVSKRTGKYKVVRMFHERGRYSRALSPCKCEVYTLGTGSWRSVAAGGPLWYTRYNLGVFLNGNVHWLLEGLKEGDNVKGISYFDLETECFSTFSIPDLGNRFYPIITRNLCVLGDSLCLCDHALGYVVEIWLMNKYGDDKSWRKVCVITGDLAKILGAPVVPIKMFKNGNVLLANELRSKLYCYSSITNTVRVVEQTKPFADLGVKPSIYVPSFLPLRTFAMENVSSF